MEHDNNFLIKRGIINISPEVEWISGTFEGAPIWNEELVNGDKEVQWSSHSGSNTNRCRSPALRRAPHPHGKVTRTKGPSSPLDPPNIAPSQLYGLSAHDSKLIHTRSPTELHYLNSISATRHSILEYQFQFQTANAGERAFFHNV